MTHPSLRWTPRKKKNDKKGRNKKWQLCSLQQFGSACLSGCSVERSSMCFRDCSGRGSAETAGSRRQTGNSWLIKHGHVGQHSGGVWGPTIQPGDKPPLYQLEQASVSRAPHHATPRHRLSATSHIWVTGHRHFQTPYTYITALIGSQGTFRSTNRFPVEKLLQVKL